MKASTQKHIVLCPHCGKEVLDHMTECPFCHGELSPSGYAGPDKEAQRRLKKTLYPLFICAALLIAAYIIFFRGTAV